MPEGARRAVARAFARSFVEGQRKIVGLQLEHRFGELTATSRRQLAAATREVLGCWAIRLLDAERLEDVLGPARRPQPARK